MRVRLYKAQAASGSRPCGEIVGDGSASDAHPQESRAPQPAIGSVAVIVPAHNEEAVLAGTLRSVLASVAPEDVFVFADACTDGTVTIAREFLPPENVRDQTENIGKSRGIEWALNEWVVPQGYQYMAVVDADTRVDGRFFDRSLAKLEAPGVVCTVGQVLAMWQRNNVYAIYRTFVYFIWQQLFKRVQGATNSVLIASGCSSVWKTSAISRIEFDHRMSTEDFNLTMQAHRRGLGKIVYAHSARVYTQEPFTFKSYYKQMYRWTRAWWESVRKYRLGLKLLRRPDRSLRVVSGLDVMTLVLLGLILPFGLAFYVVPVLFATNPGFDDAIFADRQSYVVWLLLLYTFVLISAFIVAVCVRRVELFLVSPFFLGLIYVDVFVSAWAFFSTIRRQYRKLPAGDPAATGAWASPERRRFEDERRPAK